MKRLAMYRRTVESTVAAASQLIVRRETSQPVALGNPDLFRELRGGARKSSREPEEKKCEPRDSRPRGSSCSRRLNTRRATCANRVQGG